MMYTLMSDFERDGKLDWNAYRAAQVANGERCSSCGDLVLFARGFRTQCGGCQSLATDRAEVRHDRLVRCPRCRRSWAIEVFDDDERQDVSCQNCDCDFVVKVATTVHFTSPALLPDECGEVKEEDEGEEEGDGGDNE